MPDNYKDEFGGIYSPDKKVLLQGPLDCEEYYILDGTEEIGEKAFYHRMSRLFAPSIIHIPPSVKIIRKHAFEFCFAAIQGDLSAVEEVEEEAFWLSKGIEKLQFKNLKKLGDNAFIHSVLREIDLGDKLEEVGINPFAATPIEKIICSSRNYTVEDDMFFVKQGEQKELIACMSDIYNGYVQSSFDVVKKEAFSYLEKLRVIYVNAKIIEPSAISSCEKLHLAIIGQSVTSVGDGNLSGCPMLHTVAFDHYSDFPTLGKNMFDTRGIPKNVYIHADADFFTSKYPNLSGAIERFRDINLWFSSSVAQFEIGKYVEKDYPKWDDILKLLYTDAYDMAIWDRECAKAWYFMALFGRSPSKKARIRLREMEEEEGHYTCE